MVRSAVSVMILCMVEGIGYTDKTDRVLERLPPCKIATLPSGHVPHDVPAALLRVLRRGLRPGHAGERARGEGSRVPHRAALRPAAGLRGARGRDRAHGDRLHQ